MTLPLGPLEKQTAVGFCTSVHLLMLVLFGCLPNVSTAETKFVTANTKYGEIRGTVLSYASSPNRVKSVKAFLGVPFASAPTGELRFMPPKPPLAWRPKVYDATRFRNVCLQFPLQGILLRVKKYIPGVKEPRARLSEDCLFLNIAEPGVPPTSGKYPVMVFIHGGGFKLGISFDVTGYLLALRGVVVVSIQYRLGPFGFLSRMDGMAQGNPGMLDQVEALQWVKENIEYFNGDANRVTIFGQSAGGASVALHVLSPLSRGLFRNAISMSGVALSPWATCSNKTLASRTSALARELGCRQKSRRDVFTCLQSKEAWALLNASAKVHVKSKVDLSILAGASWLPTVDGHFLTDEPTVLRRKGEFNKVPFIAGVTPNEYAFFLGMRLAGKMVLSGGINSTVAEDLTRDFAHMIQPSAKYGALLTDAIQFEYLLWPKYPSLGYLELLQKVVDFGSDYYFLAPNQAALQSHSALAPAYMFVFAHKSNLSRAAAWKGVTHTHNYPYFLGDAIVNQTAFDVLDKNVSDAMVTLWTNFAKYGEPTPAGQAVFGSTWNRFNMSNQVYLKFGGKDIVAIERDFHGSRLAFWNYFYPKLMSQSPDCPVPKHSGSSHDTKGIVMIVWVTLCLAVSIAAI